MGEIPETWRWVIGGAGSLLLAGALWRFETLARDMKNIWSEIGKLREEDKAISDKQHVHEVQALEARLKLQEKISDVLLATNTVANDTKNTAAGVERVEKQILRLEVNMQEIVKEMKKG